MDPVDLAAALSSFDDTWSPRTVATVNDDDVRAAKAQGEFPGDAPGAMTAARLLL